MEFDFWHPSGPPGPGGKLCRGGGVAGGVGGGPSEQRGGRWTERDHELQLSSGRHDLSRKGDLGQLQDAHSAECPIGWLRTCVLPDPVTGSSLRLVSRLEGRMIRVAKDNIQAIKQSSRR